MKSKREIFIESQRHYSDSAFCLDHHEEGIGDTAINIVRVIASDCEKLDPAQKNFASEFLSRRIDFGSLVSKIKFRSTATT